MRQTALEEFRIGNIPSDVRIQELVCDSTDCLMRFVASANMSFRDAAGADLWEFVHSIMRSAQAACPGIPRATPLKLYARMSRPAVTRAFRDAAHERSEGASHPFRKMQVIGVFLDAVTVFGRQVLAITIMNALLRDTAPLLVQICGNFAGTSRAYGQALRGTLEIVSKWNVEIAGFVCDGLAAQANTVDPNHVSCFFTDVPALSGAVFAWCGCHLIQLALRDATAECPTFAHAVKVIDKGAEILRSKPVIQEIGLVVPVPVAPRWAAKLNTISFIERHPDIPNQICGAVLQGRIGPSTVLDTGEGIGGRIVRTLLTEARLESLREMITGGALEYLILSGPYLEASRYMESNHSCAGDVLWLIERADETSRAWARDFAELGFIVDECAIDAVRAAFVRRFYRGRSRDIFVLASCPTLTGCIFFIERLGAAEFADPRGTAVDRFSVCPVTERILRLALDRLAEDPPVPLSPALARLNALAANAADRASVLERMAQREGLSSAELGHLEELHAEAIQNAVNRQIDFEQAVTEAAGREQTVWTNSGALPWRVQCVNELFEAAQEALKQQRLKRSQARRELSEAERVHDEYFLELENRTVARERWTIYLPFKRSVLIMSLPMSWTLRRRRSRGRRSM
jgi:hypothetical protein